MQRDVAYATTTHVYQPDKANIDAEPPEFPPGEYHWYLYHTNVVEYGLSVIIFWTWKRTVEPKNVFVGDDGNECVDINKPA